MLEEVEDAESDAGLRAFASATAWSIAARSEPPSTRSS